MLGRVAALRAARSLFTSGFEHLVEPIAKRTTFTTCEQTHRIAKSQGKPWTLADAEKDCQVVSRAVVDPANGPAYCSAEPVRRVVRSGREQTSC